MQVSVLSSRYLLLVLILGVSSSSLGQHQTPYSCDDDCWRKFHASEDRKWAKRTGLKATEISELRHIFEIDDTLSAIRIVNLDPISLRKRKHILFVVAGGNGYCLSVGVVKKQKGSFRKLLDVDGVNEEGFCRDSPMIGNPSAYIRSGNVEIKVPRAGDEPLIYNYRWNGTNYEFYRKSTGTK